ncbi:ankyrin repeat and LEM domain-containing protein 1-like [Dendronephthya gigantea]|uniref:ankyrin repeat and LEM domain-containing protein 1-like n=1 Tax=Dendronephthya gigantea TaxID=151771 RepID=UPI00106CA76F|nr:ankyrin repeat and LEM domain-containing protein 1-like [Dendronephthya gigantea]
MSTYILLLDAVRSKNLGFLKDFIKDEKNSDFINLNESDEDGITCLHVAAGLEDNAILECLLDHGAAVNCRTSEGLTPLHIAAMWGRSEQVRSLLARSADSSIVDANGCNAFMYASNSEEEGSQSCVDIILSHEECNEGFDQHSNAERRSTPESSIDFERLNSSPWVTPRRQKRKALRGMKNKELQDLLLDESTLENGHTASREHEDIEGFLTELSSADSFSYSTITGIEGSENKSLCCSDFLTECSNSDNSDSGLNEVNVGVRRDLFKDDDDGILSARCFEVSCKDGAEDVYETADEDFDGESVSIRKDTQVQGDDNEDIRREGEIVRTINFGESVEENVLNMKEEKEREVHLNDTYRIEDCYQESEEKQPLEEETVIYDWREFSVVERNETMAQIPESYKKMSFQELRRKINDHGQIPGPITPQTKLLYMKKLWRLDHGFGMRKAKETSPCSCYPLETRLVLTGRKEIPDCGALEQDIIKEFNGKRKVPWRGGTEKSSFNYLMLDPRVTLDLSQRMKKMTAIEAFRCFILAIFYVGKGKRSRPYAHLHEAVKYSKSKANQKIEHIIEIWKAGLGVISLHLFQSAIPVEAFTREACMVEALGLSQLTNKKKGEYYGLCGRLDMSKKRKLGIFFLHKAFQIFLQEGERQIRKEDI